MIDPIIATPLGIAREVRRAVLPLLVACLDAQALGLSDQRLDGPDSVYTGWLVEVVKHWPANRSASDRTASLQLSCLSTAADEHYVGVLQQMTVDAPLAAVARVLDDITGYKSIFPGVVDVHVLPGSRDGQRYVTVWEQRVPVFFLPNFVYQRSNLVDKTTPGINIYRYKLLQGAGLRASDGLTILEGLGAESTRFTAYDFFSGHWGPLPASAIWREGVRATFSADMAIKLRAENP